MITTRTIRLLRPTATALVVAVSLGAAGCSDDPSTSKATTTAKATTTTPNTTEGRIEAFGDALLGPEVGADGRDGGDFDGRWGAEAETWRKATNPTVVRTWTSASVLEPDSEAATEAWKRLGLSSKVLPTMRWRAGEFADTVGARQALSARVADVPGASSFGDSVVVWTCADDCVTDGLAGNVFYWRAGKVIYEVLFEFKVKGGGAALGPAESAAVGAALRRSSGPED